MLHFGKKFKFGKIAVNEEEEGEEESAELVRFAPQISEEKSESALPSMDFEDEEEDEPYEKFSPDPLEVEHLPDAGEVRKVLPVEPEDDEEEEPAEDDGGELPEDAPGETPEDDAFAFEQTDEAEAPEEEPEEPVSEVENTPEELPGKSADESDEEMPEASAPLTADPSPEKEDGFTADPDAAAEMYLTLRALPLTEQVYGLYGSRMMLSCPDEDGVSVYLFEDNGTYLHTAANECSAYLRVRGAEGSFRGKIYKTDDLSYLLKEKTFPITALVQARDEYDLAIRDGYLPFRQDGQSIRMIKPMSLYRMKDLALHVEYADGQNCTDSDEFLLNFDRPLIEENEGSKQFQRICKVAAEKLLHTHQPFFALQVLKKSKNLVLAFPMDGKPRVGDRFAGGVITDLAQNDDGTVVMRIGSDENVSLPVKEGKTVRGQHLITLA